MFSMTNELIYPLKSSVYCAVRERVSRSAARAWFVATGMQRHQHSTLVITWLSYRHPRIISAHRSTHHFTHHSTHHSANGMWAQAKLSISNLIAHDSVILAQAFWLTHFGSSIFDTARVSMAQAFWHLVVEGTQTAAVPRSASFLNVDAQKLLPLLADAACTVSNLKVTIAIII